ncbi:M14 family metallopeptidase [Spongiimicrobium salis]|uniref:M14 family metallopeptidase n=1 Tax=Spongiimicrobium salis TaxID=1667022 RepID=UPI00374D04E3
MKKILLPFFVLYSFSLVAQNIKSPSEFLGYELGTEFTRHHQVVDYYEYLAEVASDRLHLQEYGKTNERRTLMLAFLSSAQNMQNLEEIRKDHFKNTKGEGSATKAIVWLSYNVHGNESVSTEASMRTVYELLTSKSKYLDNTVVIIDPCINPDGRDRYVNWYNQYKNTPNTLDPNSKEHHEGWWTGRSNHYMFDLNRDWAWLTQVESQQRLRQYNKWLPHVHVDFHEQGVDNPYFFAPAAEPYHEVVSSFQRDFQNTIGKNHAKYFDRNGWLYFTKEVFDLFYPSYGDTYPTYNGAIGMTYEQGGSGRAGLAITTSLGDTLTLNDRLLHHHTTGLSTIEVASNNAVKLNEEFKKFHATKNYKYKSYVLNGNADRISALTALLDQHEIEYGNAKNGTVKGYRYSTGKYGSTKTSSSSLVVSTNQIKGTLVKVLFEPSAKLSDSLTYDITAWSLPYAYGLDATASENLVNTEAYTAPASINSSSLKGDAYAYITDWNSMEDARFLSDLLKEKIRVRYAQKPFTLEGKNHERGSLIITKIDNKNHSDFLGTLTKVVSKHPLKKLYPTNTGFVEKGKDFGSGSVNVIPQVKVAVLSANAASTLRFGEVWHFFEKQLHYPVTILDSSYFSWVDLSKYDVLILPDGRYNRFLDASRLKELKAWVRKGGKLIAMGGAIKGLDGDKGFGIKEKTQEKNAAKNKVLPHQNTQRERVKNFITGAIFKTKVDHTHPLAFGYKDTYFSLKLGSDAYDYLNRGTVAFIENTTDPITGFAGSEAKKKMKNTLVFGVEDYGSGSVIYMVDNPLFRGFWENGKLFFANALFMVN